MVQCIRHMPTTSYVSLSNTLIPWLLQRQCQLECMNVKWFDIPPFWDAELLVFEIVSGFKVKPRKARPVDIKWVQQKSEMHSIHDLVEEFSESFLHRRAYCECNYTASVICHSFDTKTAKYFLLVCNHISLFSPVSWQPNITPQAKRTEIQYYKPPPPSLSSLPNYHPSLWKPFGWVSNHSNLHLRCLKTRSPWRRRGARLHGNGTRCSLRIHLHE